MQSYQNNNKHPVHVTLEFDIAATLLLMGYPLLSAVFSEDVPAVARILDATEDISLLQSEEEWDALCNLIQFTEYSEAILGTDWNNQHYYNGDEFRYYEKATKDKNGNNNARRRRRKDDKLIRCKYYNKETFNYLNVAFIFNKNIETFKLLLHHKSITQNILDKKIKWVNQFWIYFKWEDITVLNLLTKNSKIIIIISG